MSLRRRPKSTRSTPPARSTVPEGVMTHPSLRVSIIEDSVVATEALQELLRELPELQLLSVSSTGQDGIRRAAELRPDVFLMDIHLPDIDGVDATRQITAGLPGTTVIVITSE